MGFTSVCTGLQPEHVNFALLCILVSFFEYTQHLCTLQSGCRCEFCNSSSPLPYTHTNTHTQCRCITGTIHMSSIRYLADSLMRHSEFYLRHPHQQESCQIYKCPSVKTLQGHYECYSVCWVLTSLTVIVQLVMLCFVCTLRTQYV